jgi:sensor histidine kinase YesM
MFSTIQSGIEILVIALNLMLFIFKTNNKKPDKLFILYPILSVGFVVVAPYLKNYENWSILVIIFVVFILPIFFIKNIPKKVITLSAFLVSGLCTDIHCIAYIPTVMLHLNENVRYIIQDIVFLAEIIIFFILLNKKSIISMINVFFTFKKSLKIMVVAFLWEICLLEVVIMILIDDFKSNTFFIIECILSLMIFLFTFVVFFNLIKSYISTTYYKKLNKTIEKNMVMQVSYYDNINKANESLRKFRHDYKNLKIGLNSYLDNGDLQGAKSYLESCDSLSETDYIAYNTGHNIVNALISDKANKIKDKGIKIEFNGVIPKDILSPTDLCIVFGNTLDNAIEACLNSQNKELKTIKVNVKKSGDCFFIEITNPVDKKVEIKNNTITTTKDDKELHGLGIGSVKNVVKKYNGHINITCSDTTFKVDLDFII